MTSPSAQVSWPVNGEQRLRAKGGDRGASPRPIARSFPAAEILRQYRIMRRFQEHETECRQTLREEFGFEFLDPPNRIL